MAMPPSDFSGRAGRCGVHSWPFLCSGLPLSISADSAETVAVTPEVVIRSASSRSMSSPATGFRPAAARSRAEAAPPIEVPRAVLVGADERSGIFFGFGLAGLGRAQPLPPWPICSAQSATEPLSGAPLKSACGASENPLGCSGSAASRNSVSGLRRRRSEAPAGCGEDFEGIWPCRKYERVAADGKGGCRSARGSIGLLTQGCQEASAFRLDRKPSQP